MDSDQLQKFEDAFKKLMTTDSPKGIEVAELLAQAQVLYALGAISKGLLNAVLEELSWTKPQGAASPIVKHDTAFMVVTPPPGPSKLLVKALSQMNELQAPPQGISLSDVANYSSQIVAKEASPPMGITYNLETDTLVVANTTLIGPVIAEKGLTVQLSGTNIKDRADGKTRPYMLLRRQEPHAVRGKKKVAAAVRGGGKVLLGALRSTRPY